MLARVSIGLWLAAALAGAAETTAPAVTSAPAAGKKSSDWVFSLLPKSFQKNPHVELTVITEMTDEGRKLPPVSPAAPAYFELFSSGYQVRGDMDGSRRTVSAEDVERLLTRALATNGYRKAELPEHPPTLLIFYTWGAHNRLTDPDDENPTLSSEQIARNLLDRAALVGGRRFAEDMLKLFEEADALYTAARTTMPEGVPPVFTPEMLDFVHPVNRFKRRSPKNEFLFDQAADDLYYVVASAYDYAGVGRRERRLLWRTRMTVAAQGVSQEQTLPTLVLTAAPFFGRDMAEAETLTRRAVPEGKVEIGTPTVIEPNAKTSPR